MRGVFITFFCFSIPRPLITFYTSLLQISVSSPTIDSIKASLVCISKSVHNSTKKTNLVTRFYVKKAKRSSFNNRNLKALVAIGSFRNSKFFLFLDYNSKTLKVNQNLCCSTNWSQNKSRTRSHRALIVTGIPQDNIRNWTICAFEKLRKHLSNEFILTNPRYSIPCTLVVFVAFMSPNVTYSNI